MLPWIIGSVLGVGGVWAYEHFKAKPTHPSIAPPGHPVPGLPTSGPAAPVGLTPPGVPQPPGQVISLPPVKAPADPLQVAAAALMQGLQNGTVGTGPSPLTQSFQSAYNAYAKPSVPLGVDAKYGPKSQAALQSVVTPAIAPQASLAHPVVSPAVPAAPANPTITNPQQAASDLLTFFASGAKKGSFPQVSTFQAAWNSVPGNTPLIVDGKYGANGQAALQGLLTWMGTTTPAPKNAYGAAKAPLTFMGSAATAAGPMGLAPGNLGDPSANALQQALANVTGGS